MSKGPQKLKSLVKLLLTLTDINGKKEYNIINDATPKWSILYFELRSHLEQLVLFTNKLSLKGRNLFTPGRILSQKAVVTFCRGFKIQVYGHFYQLHTTGKSLSS